ncbi:MAG: hypothetical protein L0287_07865, partial [Anaerolineae bacterium]|nr:hypothetical protein [Anaerolineae bacterium]
MTAQKSNIAGGVDFAQRTLSLSDTKRSPPFQNIKKWLDKEGSAYAFLSMYAVMFIIFIVIPVVVAILLSFTFFDTI